MLKIQGLTAGYGSLIVLHDIALEIPSGSIVAILGANGVGKTTLMRALTGSIKLLNGTISLDGKQIERLAIERRVRSGLALVPENRELFSSLTVRENLIIGAYTRRSRAEIEDSLARVLEYFPRLKTHLQLPAASLSGGEGQMLAIGRALMSHPRVLLLDEPSQGLAPIIVDTVLDVIQKLNRERELTIVLVEQNARKALTIASQAYVLQGGSIALQGATKDLITSRAIQELYLGG